MLIADFGIRRTSSPTDGRTEVTRSGPWVRLHGGGVFRGVVREAASRGGPDRDWSIAKLRCGKHGSILVLTATGLEAKRVRRLLLSTTVLFLMGGVSRSGHRVVIRRDPSRQTTGCGARARDPDVYRCDTPPSAGCVVG